MGEAGSDDSYLVLKSFPALFADEARAIDALRNCITLSEPLPHFCKRRLPTVSANIAPKII
jgi:hypothetical protein